MKIVFSYLFHIKRRFLYFFMIGFVISFNFLNCANQELVDQAEAYNEIYFALRFKARECGVEIPRLPIILSKDVSRRNLDLCTISITSASCSAIDYPLPCLLLYLPEDQGDIPWYANFNDLSKVRVNL